MFRFRDLKDVARDMIKDMGPGGGALMFIFLTVLMLPLYIIAIPLYPIGKALEWWVKE